MAKNGISTLTTKQERQIAKLDLAQTKRQQTGTVGYRNLRYYDLALLPTKYSGNDVVYTSHPDGLVQGRPWKTTPNTVLGLWRSVYNGYFGEDTDYIHWFNSQTPASEGPASDFSIDGIVTGDNTSVEWIGYFKAPHTANYVFYLYSDDTSILWIGDKAITNYTMGNWDVYADAGSGESFTDPIALVAGQDYPIRVQYGNGTGDYYLNVSWEDDFIVPVTTYELVDPTGANRDYQVAELVDIQVHSSSFNAAPPTNGTITINGDLIVDANQRGHTVLLMTADGTIISTTNYDTYDPGQGRITALNNDLISNPSGTIIVMCTYDACSVDNSTRAILNGYYGGTLTDTWLAERVTHIFIGQKV